MQESNDLTLTGNSPDVDPEDPAFVETAFEGEALVTAGAINLQRNADFGFPSLTEVRDGVTLAQGASLGAPLLTKIGKSLTLREKAWLGAPELAFIGGYLDCDESARLITPRFTN